MKRGWKKQTHAGFEGIVEKKVDESTEKVTETSGGGGGTNGG